MSILSDEGNLISKQPIQDDGLKSQYVSTNAGLLSCYYYLDVDMFNKNMGHVGIGLDHQPENLLLAQLENIKVDRCVNAVCVVVLVYR